MTAKDDFSEYYEEYLDGQYDCVDRIVLNGYFPMGQQGGGFRYWWRNLTGSDENLTQDNLVSMAGRFSRRVHAHAQKHHIPIIHCKPDVRKHELAERYLPADRDFQGVFLILVAKAPALVWVVTHGKNGVPHLERKTPWPYVNHYHFHIMDKEWGHLTIKMSGHPPFGVQIMLNGHEWVERRARKQTISSMMKEGNCFVGCSDFMTLDRIADTLRDDHAIGRLADVCDRWVYSGCLCFALDTEEQKRSEFRYRYSCFQLEYSRNLVFTRGRVLDEVYQGLIDRVRRLLDVKTLRTIFGWKCRPYQRSRPGRSTRRVERIVDETTYDVTVFKVHFGRLTLKMYDKGDRVLRIEAIAHNVKDLRCGKVLEKLSVMLEKLQRMVTDFLNTVYVTHKSFIDCDALDTLHQPTQRGARRLAGVDMQKSRTRAVGEALLALAPNPEGFTCFELAEKVRALQGYSDSASYTSRHALYDLSKFRGKHLVERVEHKRRFRCSKLGVRLLAGFIILVGKVIKPVLAGVCKARPEPKPRKIHPIDTLYENLQGEMFALLDHFALVA